MNLIFRRMKPAADDFSCRFITLLVSINPLLFTMEDLLFNDGNHLRLDFLPIYHILVKQFTERHGENMQLVLMIVFFSVVNLLFILGVSGLYRISISKARLLICLALSALYVIAVLTVKYKLLHARIMYFIFIALTGLVAFGRHSVVPHISFIILYLAFGGFGFQYSKLISLLTGTAGLWFISVARSLGSRKLLPVCVNYGGVEYCFRALLDTGNMLRDPISGKPVLVISADIAQKISGLSLNQISNPLESLGVIPGLRLIPYKTVGQSGVFLLGLNIPKLIIGNWCGSGIIAFSPQILCEKGTYQALTGGYV